MGNSCPPARLLAHEEEVLSKATEFQLVGVREVEARCGDVDRRRYKGSIRNTLHLPRGGLPACGESPTEDGEIGLENKPRGWPHRG